MTCTGVGEGGILVALDGGAAKPGNGCLRIITAAARASNPITNSYRSRGKPSAVTRRDFVILSWRTSLPSRPKDYSAFAIPARGGDSLAVPTSGLILPQFGNRGK